MNIIKKIICMSIIAILLSSFISSSVLAKNDDYEIRKLEYTEAFKKYLQLPDSEKKKVLAPKLFDIPKSENLISNTTAKVKNVLGKGAEDKKFSLKDIIPENTVVRDQKQTNFCWAFAYIAALESNLALQNYKSNKEAKVYDFSEKHLVYGSTRFFANNAINEYGFNFDIKGYGTDLYGINYLTNGMGAVDESDLPFDESTDLIDISNIQNKQVKSRIYDIVEFPIYNSTDDTTEIKNKLKKFITEHGAVYAGIHGAALDSEYCNIKTGAIYCDNSTLCPMDHAVSIIGWDDEFKKEDFAEKHQPKKDGAWIVKNSWGDKVKIDSVENSKQAILEIVIKEYPELGITSADQITDEMFENVCQEMGYFIDGDSVYQSIGDNGIMYISYEDVNIYQTLYGIENATDTIDYENIYQYNELGETSIYSLSNNVINLANVFTKKTSGNEYLSEISLFVPETQKIKAFINPTGSDKSVNSLVALELEGGSTATLEPGYHTLKLKQPFEITGNEYVISLEIESLASNNTPFAVETNTPDWDADDYVKIESGKCFIATSSNFKANKWDDLSTISSISSALTNADSTIKAFTTSKKPASYTSINTTTKPGETKNPTNPTYTNSTISTDPTISPTILPYTGKTALFIILGSATIVLTFVIRKKYTNLKDIK